MASHLTTQMGPMSDHTERPRAWLQRMASRMTTDTLYLATEKGLTLAAEKGLTPGYKEGSRAWLQRRASRLTTEKSLMPDHIYLVAGYREGACAWLQRMASRLTKEKASCLTQKE